VLTPHLDSLARSGVRLARSYSVSSVCTPSRYICLAGQYASRCTSPGFLRACPEGTQANVGFNVQITPDTPNLASVLKQAGYATGFVGKWHTGTPALLSIPRDADFRDPAVAQQLDENQKRLCERIRACGFVYAGSVYRGNLADHKLDTLTVHNQEWVTQGALEFLDRYGDQPFFLHVCTTLQHSPSPTESIGGDPRMPPAALLPEAPRVQAARDSILPRLREAGIDERMAHATWLDDAVGAIVRKLDEIGQRDNTLVIFFSDNGTLRGKGTCYEGGAHTPALIAWPGQIPAGETCNALVANIDFAPTILEACGAAAPAALRIDGRSLLGLLNHQETDWRKSLLLEIGHTRGVVTDRWKYIALRYPPALQRAIDAGTLGRPAYHMDTVFDLQQVAERNHPAYHDADQLYDLQADPDEKSNLARDPARADQLAELKRQLRDSLATIPRPFGEFAP
jgi:arylsulfatase A-like enzyme